MNGKVTNSEELPNEWYKQGCSFSETLYCPCLNAFFVKGRKGGRPMDPSVILMKGMIVFIENKCNDFDCLTICFID